MKTNQKSTIERNLYAFVCFILNFFFVKSKIFHIRTIIQFNYNEENKKMGLFYSVKVTHFCCCLSNGIAKDRKHKRKKTVKFMSLHEPLNKNLKWKNINHLSLSLRILTKILFGTAFEFDSIYLCNYVSLSMHVNG